MIPPAGPSTAPGLDAQFAWARDHVASDPVALLAAAFEPLPDGADPIIGLVAGLDHVGFLAAEPVEEVAAAAARAGFDRDQATEPSSVVARELGGRLRGAAVPTTIFRARPGAGPGVEVFLPSGVPPAVLDGWRASSVGRHLAFRLRDPAALDPVVARLVAAGYERPPVMHAGPVAVGAVDIMYLDRLDGTRIELCAPR